jgi:hypothetical protein
MGGKGGGGSNGNGNNEMMGFAAMMAAEKQYQLGMEQLKWSKEVYAKYEPYILDSTKQQVADQHFQSDMSRAQWDQYNDTYKPIETSFAREASTWDTPERQQANAGKAQAMVASQFEQARQAASQQLESFGIDPSSTRYGALDLASRTQQASAQAAAGTKAIDDTQMQGMALKSGVVNTGRGFQNNINQTTGVGSSAGAAGVGGLTNFFQTSSNAMTAPVAWFNAGNQAQGNAITAFNNYTNNAIKQQQANTQSASAGMQGIQGMLGSIMSLNEGGAIPEDGMPPSDAPIAGAGMAQEGGHVPHEASPSKGAIPDDVNARLSPGEFVIPADAVKWLGEKQVYSMIDKAKQERAQVEATTETRPSMQPPLPGPPQFVSKSGRSAIPA